MPVAGGPRATQGQAEQGQFNGECNAAVPPSTGACRFQCGRRSVLAFDSESESQNYAATRIRKVSHYKSTWCHLAALSQLRKHLSSLTHLMSTVTLNLRLALLSARSMALARHTAEKLECIRREIQCSSASTSPVIELDCAVLSSIQTNDLEDPYQAAHSGPSSPVCRPIC